MQIKSSIVPVQQIHTLDLNQKEVQFLFDIMNRISGDPYHSRRIYVNRFLTALKSAGINKVDGSADLAGQIQVINSDYS